ncbi:hypothetical protein IP84_14810 [beta proteobacterium AAP99]|nr:hypothetical protein IP84_14810 [beta proteobacterium AAP99]
MPLNAPRHAPRHRTALTAAHTTAAPLAEPAPQLSLQLLGAPAVVRADGSSTQLEKRAAGLLALVALQPGSSRAHAAALLWPDSENPRRALRQQLLRFRRSFGLELIEGEDVLRLSPVLRVEALDGGAGELLGTLSFEDCGDFADWLATERDRRRGGAAAQLNQKLTAAQAEGDLDAALQAAQELLRTDFESEVYHRNLMRVHYLRGDMAQAQAVYARLKQHLHTRYGVAPSQETEQLARASQQAVAAQSASASRLPTVPVTVLRPPRLIGRQTELLQVRAAWAQSRAVLVLGEPGLGKTRLLNEVIVGRRALLAQGRPGDSGVPYATLARMLRSLIDHFELVLDEAQRLSLARLLPELAPGTVLPAEAPGLALRQTVEAAIAAAHQDGAPLEVMVIDDLHFADDASIEMIQSLISALHRQLDFALAQRPGEGSAAAGMLRAQLEEARFMEPLVLAPLREHEVAELIDSLDIEDLDTQALAAPLTRHTGGNPLFALETVKQGLATGQLRAGQLPQPDAVGTLIERRLKQLPEKAIALARVAAIAGPDFSIQLAEHCMGMRALALTDVLNTLQDAQVVRDAGFAHDLVADAVLRSIPALIARALHADVARWLEVHNGEPARMASHWLAAGEAQSALPWLHRAAQRAMQTLRPREAVGFLLQAMEIEDRLGQRAAAFKSLEIVVDLRLRVDLDETLLSQLDLLDRLASSPGEEIVALLARADYCMHRMETLDAGRQAAARAAELAHATGDAAHLNEAQSTLAVLEVMSGRTAEALALVDEFLPRARTWPDDEPRCNLLSKAGYVLVRSPRALEGADLFDESARQSVHLPRVRLVALANAAHARVQLNQPEAALACIEQSDQLRAAHDDMRGSGNANAFMRAQACELLGRYGEALHLLDATVEQFRERAPGKLAHVLIDRARLWLDIGQVTRAMQDLARAREACANRQGELGLHLLEWRMHELRLGAAPQAFAHAVSSYHAVRVALARTVVLDDDAARAALEAVVAQARQGAYRGLEAAALARLARRAGALGNPERAAGFAREAVALAAGRNTSDLTWPEIVLHAAPQLQAAGAADEARRLYREGAAWVQRARDTLPAPFQPSYLVQNAAARELLSLSSRNTG